MPSEKPAFNRSSDLFNRKVGHDSSVVEEGRDFNSPSPESSCAQGREILDACCGGRMWWWDKAHPLAVYMDKREASPGSVPPRPNWSCEPDIIGDFRDMPFADDAFRLVVFDPPHNIRKEPSGYIGMCYGALPRETEQEDLRRGFNECWRVLAPGGSLIFKWWGDLGRVTPHFPTAPTVGTRGMRSTKDQTWWLIFYKPLSGIAEPWRDQLDIFDAELCA